MGYSWPITQMLLLKIILKIGCFGLIMLFFLCSIFLPKKSSLAESGQSRGSNLLFFSVVSSPKISASTRDSNSCLLLLLNVRPNVFLKNSCASSAFLRCSFCNCLWMDYLFFIYQAGFHNRTLDLRSRVVMNLRRENWK